MSVRVRITYIKIRSVADLRFALRAWLAVQRLNRRLRRSAPEQQARILAGMINSPLARVVKEDGHDR